MTLITTSINFFGGVLSCGFSEFIFNSILKRTDRTPALPDFGYRGPQRTLG
jgi:hypothetical protein